MGDAQRYILAPLLFHLREKDERKSEALNTLLCYSVHNDGLMAIFRRNGASHESSVLRMISLHCCGAISK